MKKRWRNVEESQIRERWALDDSCIRNGCVEKLVDLSRVIAVDPWIIANGGLPICENCGQDRVLCSVQVLS